MVPSPHCSKDAGKQPTAENSQQQVQNSAPHKPNRNMAPGMGILAHLGQEGQKTLSVATSPKPGTQISSPQPHIYQGCPCSEPTLILGVSGWEANIEKDENMERFIKYSPNLFHFVLLTLKARAQRNNLCMQGTGC